jgi:hypothetical protein
MSDLNNPTTASSIERQLGEVVGTVRMTVAAIDNLRISVERLTERAAFRSDVDAVRDELRGEIEVLRENLSKRDSEIRKAQIWMATVTGIGLAITALMKFVDFGLRVTVGG